MIVNMTTCCIILYVWVIMRGNIVIVNMTACCIIIVQVGNHEKVDSDRHQDCMLYYYCTCG